MTKAELVDEIAKQAGITKKAAAAAVNAFVKAIYASLKKKGSKIRIADLGTFAVLHRKARTAVNPQTRKKMNVPAMNVPRFRASKSLKEAVAKPK